MTAYPPRHYGIDYIGGVNYRRVIRKHHPEGWAAGFLCKASGWRNGILAARALAKTGKCPVMRIHGLWKDDHHFTSVDIKTAVQQAKKVAKLAEQYPKIKIFYSPWLEHRASGALFKKVKKACRKVLPAAVKVVNSGNVIVRGVNEVHHGAPVPGSYIFSFDGIDVFKANLDYWIAVHNPTVIGHNCIQFYLWTPRCNGKRYANDSTPRSKRKNWLRKIDINRMVKQLRGN